MNELHFKPSKVETRVRRLSHWNRRAWQQIVNLETRLDVVENQLQISDSPNETFPEGDPWEREIVTNVIWLPAFRAFVLGVAIGAIIAMVILWS